MCVAALDGINISGCWIEFLVGSPKWRHCSACLARPDDTKQQKLGQ
jgi:hypothetical protein